jgi:hypothetical protein
LESEVDYEYREEPREVRREMGIKVKKYIAFFVALLLFSLAMVSIVAGAGSLTLPSTPQAPGGVVPISGLSFGASKAVGIGFGAEVAVANETFLHPGSGFGPFSITLANTPVKPGTFVLNIDVNSGLTTIIYTDNGAGGLASTAPSFVSGTIDYVSGKITYYTNTDPTGYTIVRKAFYTSYQYNVTPGIGVNTTASGSFTASIVVPSVGSGNYNITAIDTAGNRVVGSLIIDVAVPESLTIGALVLLSSIAVIASSRYFRRPILAT